MVVQAADGVVLANAGFDGRAPLPGPLAIGLKRDRIAWVAMRDEVGDAAHPVELKAQVHAFEGAFAAPGFHDAHLHFFHSALYASPLAASFVGRNEADCVERLRAFASTRPRGSWLLAQGWREYLWDDARMPSRTSLDAAFPHQPVALYSGDAHTLWLNGCALDELGIGEESTPPAGGTYERDGDGRLTGIVRETAAMELMPKITGAFSTSELLDAYDAFQMRLLASGVTSVSDMALSATSGLDFIRDDLFSELDRAGRLHIRAHLFPALLPGTDRLAKLQERLMGTKLRACGWKQFFDGVSSQHTAWLAEPYANARASDDRGRPTVEPGVMEELVGAALEAGERVRIHAIGDAAIHEALGIFERVRSRCARPGQMVLEHLENFQSADVARLARLGVMASVQPCHITLDPGGPERDLGEGRTPWMWPFRQLLDAGAALAFGTDSPVCEPEPLRSIYVAMTRQDARTRKPEGGWLPAERITADEALSAHTVGSAQACGRGHELGMLAPGMLADIALFDEDLLRADPDQLLDARLVGAFVGGERVI